MSNMMNKYFDKIKDEKILTLEEEKDLCDKCKEGDVNAKNKLIVANLKLVMKIAQSYINYGIEFDDLIQEGNMGLVHAVDLFDADKGKFSTFAAYHIKEYMRNAIDKSKIVFTGSYEECKHNEYGKVSLNEKVGEDGENELIDGFADNGKDASFNLSNKEIMQIIMEGINHLPELEKYIVINHLGLNEEGVKYTQLEIAEHIKFEDKFKNVKNYTRQRIQQLLKLGLQKLQNYILKKI